MVQQLSRSIYPAKTKVVVIAGATASGKSSLAIELAKSFPQLNPYIVNADSRQVYKDFQIGTATPVAEEIKGDAWIIDGIEHYLYGYVDPSIRFTVSDFEHDLEQLIFNERFQNRLAIIVGGTGLYIDSFVYNIVENSGEEDSELRELLNQKSLAELQLLVGDQLGKLNESDRANPRRLIRLIERNESGKATTESERKIREDIDLLYLYLDISKEELNPRIDTRTMEMMRLGLKEENQRLRSIYGSENPIINSTISYKEFNQAATDDQLIKLIALHNRQYAKKQRTWFKKNKDIIKIQNLQDAIREIDKSFLRV